MMNMLALNKQFKKFSKRVLAASSIIVTRLPKSARDSVLLTFDDGPHPTLTPQVLDILSENNAIACFFVVGKFAEKEPYLVREMVRRGHVLGNHTYSHNVKQLGPHAYAREIIKCQHTLFNISGIHCRLFRPMQGKMTIASTITSRYLGQKQMLWSIGGGEWGDCQHLSAKEIGDRLISKTCGGDIVMLHDNNEKIPSVLKKLVLHLRQNNIDLANGIHAI